MYIYVHINICACAIPTHVNIWNAPRVSAMILRSSGIPMNLKSRLKAYGTVQHQLLT